MSSNPFAAESAGRIYASGRPEYSSHVTAIIRRLTGITHPVSRAVDVGSGTGISTMALVPLADTVIGVEPSSAMLEHATQAASVTYRQGSAEDLPVDDGTCDLIAVGSALHWFHKGRFAEEASRVARPDAWLVIHDHFFRGQIEGDPRFFDWVRNVYLDKYPPPPRDRSWQPPDDLLHWRHVDWEQYDQRIQLDADGFASYLVTQSNLQTVIERRDETREGLKAWVRSETAPFFSDDPARTFLFGGFVACHRQAL